LSRWQTLAAALDEELAAAFPEERAAYQQMMAAPATDVNGATPSDL